MKNKPRIGVNLLHLIPGEVGGSEEYSVQTLTAVANHGSLDFEPVLFVLEDFQKEHPELCSVFETVICKVKARKRFKRILAESTWLKLKSRDCDAIHHFGGRLPLLTKRPNAVTIHDLQPLERPKNFSFIKRTFFRYVLPATVRRSEIIVATSSSVKEKLVEIFHLNPAFIQVVSTGVKHVVEIPNSPKDPLKIFYPAITHPHKNHQVLIEAFNQIAKKNQEVHLVMSGAPGRAEKEVKSHALSSPYKDRIIFTGRVSTHELENILRSSLFLAFPSTYEGFGIPVLEAMASGLPVVVAKGTPAEKLVGEKSIKVDPYDVAAWVDAFEMMLIDLQLRNEIALENIKLAKGYTWDASASQLIDAWKRLIMHTEEKK